MLINTHDELLDAWNRAFLAMQQTATSIQENLEGKPAFEAMTCLRFSLIAKDPTDPLEPVNLTEHLNQMFTCLVSYAAADYLIARDQAVLPVTLNIGTDPGFDIEAANASIIGECFSAVNPSNNRKIQMDRARLEPATASEKFVFFYSPVPAPQLGNSVKIVHLSLENLMPPNLAPG